MFIVLALRHRRRVSAAEGVETDHSRAASSPRHLAPRPTDSGRSNRLLVLQVTVHGGCRMELYRVRQNNMSRRGNRDICVGQEYFFTPDFPCLFSKLMYFFISLFNFNPLT